MIDSNFQQDLKQLTTEQILSGIAVYEYRVIELNGRAITKSQNRDLETFKAKIRLAKKELENRKPKQKKLI